MSETDVKKIFSKNLTRLMNLNEKKQIDLMNDLNLSSSTLSNWCTGLKMPRMDKIQMLADYFGVLKSDLIEDKTSYGQTVQINELIKKRRLELGLTLKDVAKALNTAESTISRYESNDIQNMGIDKIEALSKVLDCSPAYLMGWEDNSGQHIQINPLTGKKMTKREISQHEKVMNEATLMFNNEDISEEDKEKLMMALNDMFWKAKQKNKEKYAKSHTKNI